MAFLIKKRDALLVRYARRAILKYEPGIIAITGGVGTAVTQSALAAVLRDLRSLRTTCEAFQANLRMPLAALGDWKEGRNVGITKGFLFWSNALIRGFKTSFFAAEYPELLLLECPRGESANFLALARPQITVVTALADENAEDAARLVAVLPSNGYAVVNGDDPRTRRVTERTRARTITFGFKESADVRITGFAHRSDKVKNGYRPLGISFVLKYGAQSAHVAIDNAFGKAAAYAAAASACVGTAFGLHLVRAAESLRYAELPENHMHLSIGKKGIYLMNDTATDTETGMRNALDTILELPARRVIGVFGTLDKKEKREGGPAPQQSGHEALNRLAVQTCDAIITVGKSPLTVDNKKKIRFDTGEEAAAELQAIIERDDLVLLTGRGLEAVLAALCSYRLVVRT